MRDLAGSLATRPMPLPCSKTSAEPTRSRLGDLVDAAPGQPRPKASAGTYLAANTGLQHPLSTLHERRHRLPCKTRFRLAGCAFTGRGSNPLDRFERFQVTSHSPFQDFACRKGCYDQCRTRGRNGWDWQSHCAFAQQQEGQRSSGLPEVYAFDTRYQPPVRCVSARTAFEGSDVTFCAFRFWACDRVAAQVVPYIGAVVPADRP